MICKECKRWYEKWSDNPIENHLCKICNDEKWKEWEIKEADNLKEIDRLQEKGHSHHCACRQIYGDGECECDLYKMGYDPYKWLKRQYLQEIIR